MLEAMVVEMSVTASRSLGLSALVSRPGLRSTTPETSVTLTTPGVFSKETTLALQALINDGQARVLANPRIATVNGKEALIDIGETRFFRSVSVPGNGQAGQPIAGALIPIFTVERVQVGVILRVTPTVGFSEGGAEPEILLDLRPEVSSISGVSAEGLPEVSRRQAQSSLRVKDGESIIIGGLRQREYARSTRRVPILSEIPLLGKLFRSTTKQSRESELVIVVTPRIIGVGNTFESLPTLQPPRLLK
jgi:type IV pilus assembly protein PilQ